MLVIDDLHDLRELLDTQFGHQAHVRVLLATTLQEAARLFNLHHRDIVTIYVDGCVEQDHDVDTLPLIHAFRKAGFCGTMIATSSSRENSHRMVDAGCDSAIDKWRLLDHIQTHFRD